MGYIVRQVFLILFLGFALIGYSYFGPPQHTHFLTSTRVYRLYVGPTIDRMLLSGEEGSITVGSLAAFSGDLSFRPSSELVFLPARVGQRFYGGTLVSSGEGSAAVITLADNSELKLAANSTVFLEFPQGNAESGTILLKVLKGTIEAQKDKENSQVKLRIVTPQGRVAKMSNRRIVIVAPLQKLDPRKKSSMDFFSGSQKPAREYVGYSEETPGLKKIESELIEGRPLTTTQRTDIFEKSLSTDQDLESALNQPLAQQAESDDSKTVVLAPPVPTVPASIPVVEPATPAPTVAVTSQPLETPAPKLPSTPKPAVAKAPLPKRLPTRELPVAKLSATKLPVNAPIEREPASVPAAPIKIGERKSVARVEVKKFEAPTSASSELSAAMYASQQGENEKAQQLVASALTKTEYDSTTFNDATRFSVEEITKSYLDAHDCEQAKATILNVGRAYARDPSSVDWSKKWRALYKEKCQSN